MRGSEPRLPRWARQISGILRTFSSSPANCQEWCCTMISSRWSGPLKKVKNRRWSGYTGSLAITVVNLLISWNSPMQSMCTIVFGGFVHRSCSLVHRMRGGPRIQVSYNQQKTRRRMKWSKKPSCSGSAPRTPGLCSIFHVFWSRYSSARRTRILHFPFKASQIILWDTYLLASYFY